MLAYKLFTVRKDGTLGPLFINRHQVIPVGEWLTAGTHPRKGYAVRYGWHAMLRQSAPHLMKRDGGLAGNRTWALVELDSATVHHRPDKQGGSWVQGERMRVLEVLPSRSVVAER